MLIGEGARRIHYDLVGPDEGPVVCMTHALSADSGVWLEQTPVLTRAGYRVLRLDMRGHGGSGAIDVACNMADLAGDVLAALDFLGFERVHFVGLSVGGMIGQTLAVEHAARLRSMMLSGSSPAAPPGGVGMWEERFAAIRRAGSAEPLADDAMRRWFTDAFQARRPDRWKMVRATIAAVAPAGYIRCAEAIIRFDVQAQLPGVRAPTLVVCGDGDPGTPPEGNRKIANLIPGARYEEIPDARHLPMMERPDMFNRLMLDWLASRS